MTPSVCIVPSCPSTSERRLHHPWLLPHYLPLCLQLLKSTTDKAREMAESAQGYSQSVAWVQGQFAAAQAAVDAGDLQAALDALAPVRGFAGPGVAEWAADAETRLAADRALTVARARAALLSASLY